MSLLIQHGELVTAETRCFADILCEGERITRIEPKIAPPHDAMVLDARGKLVFPGFVDPHVHAYLPLKNTSSKDDYASTSVAALMGGTTCFIDFCGAGREESPLQAWDRWERQSKGRSACDFSYHMTVARFDERTALELEEVVRRGVTSFKIYLAYKNALNLSDQELFKTLQFAAGRGILTVGHCENAEVVFELQQKMLAEGKTGPEWHYHSRPPSVEEEGVHHFLTFAELTGAPVYIAHLSCNEALQAALPFRQRGVKCSIETMVHYLLLDKSYAERGGFEAAKYVLSPPLREKKNQDILWAALRDGLIDTVGTDHAPFDFYGQKTMGRENFTLIPNGIGSIENRVQLLYTCGVCRGLMDVQTMVAVASANPARLFGLYPRKGALEPGSDADLVIYDPAYEGRISAKHQFMKVDYNPYEGFPVQGRPDIVTVRGAVAVRDGRFVGDRNRGRFVARPVALLDRHEDA
ncbi:MAG: dihydropyrimidinase [Lentisphaerota bacterium]